MTNPVLCEPACAAIHFPRTTPPLARVPNLLRGPNPLTRLSKCIVNFVPEKRQQRRNLNSFVAPVTFRKSRAPITAHCFLGEGSAVSTFLIKRRRVSQSF